VPLEPPARKPVQLLLFLLNLIDVLLRAVLIDLEGSFEIIE
jgi:hypothetical protein